MSRVELSSWYHLRAPLFRAVKRDVKLRDWVDKVYAHSVGFREFHVDIFSIA